MDRRKETHPRIPQQHICQRCNQGRQWEHLVRHLPQRTLLLQHQGSPQVIHRRGAFPREQHHSRPQSLWRNPLHLHGRGRDLRTGHGEFHGNPSQGQEREPHPGRTCLREYNVFQRQRLMVRNNTARTYPQDIRLHQDLPR